VLAKQLTVKVVEALRRAAPSVCLSAQGFDTGRRGVGPKAECVDGSIPNLAAGGPSRSRVTGYGGLWGDHVGPWVAACVWPMRIFARLTSSRLATATVRRRASPGQSNAYD